MRIEANRAGFAYVDTIPPAFERGRLRICDGPQSTIGMNHIRLRSVEGVVDQVVHPGNWIHNSLHPNERGHGAMADALDGWLDTKQDFDRTPRADLPEYTAPRLDRVMTGPPPDRICGQHDEPSHCDRDENDWAVTQLAGLTLIAAVPLGLIAAGWWLLWLPVLAWSRPRCQREGDRLARALFRSDPRRG